MKFRRINANLRHVDKELTFHLDLESVGDGQTITEWQTTIEEIKMIHLVYSGQWYLSYFVAMDISKEEKKS